MNVSGISAMVAAMLVVQAWSGMAADDARLLQLPAERHQSRPHQIPTPNCVPQFGESLAGLTPAELAAFAAGRDNFQNEDAVATGLGPIYNGVSCAACHSIPATGGSSSTNVIRFGRVEKGVFDPLTELGGSLLQRFAIDPAFQEVIPRKANVIAQRHATALFGLGLIEAIPDQTILQNATQPKPDGVRGRASIVEDVTTGEQRVGRFGWKAQQATLLAFAADAYLNEVGITSRFFPHENAPNGNTAILAIADTVADPEDTIDPETGKADIDTFADFMRFLAPPPPLPLTKSARLGRVVFYQLGCAVCHTPRMQTGTNPVTALHLKQVRLYSDLLLHNMGMLGDGIGQGLAEPCEMKTAPLWGLRARARYLHDGRAESVCGAIAAHDGEARTARDRFLRLNPGARQHLLDFLDCL